MESLRGKEKTKRFSWSWLALIFILISCDVYGITISDGVDYITTHNKKVSRVEAFFIMLNTSTYAKRYDIDAELLLAIMHTESTFDRYAISPRWKARGLMQVRWKIWKDLLVNHSIKREDLYTQRGIEAGCLVLRHYLNKYKTLDKALWGYNGKPKTKKYIRKILGRLEKIRKLRR